MDHQKKWQKTKKIAHDVKIAVPLENHLFEVKSQAYHEDNFFSNARKLHKKMQTILKPLEWKVYKALYIDNLSEEEAAKKEAEMIDEVADEILKNRVDPIRTAHDGLVQQNDVFTNSLKSTPGGRGRERGVSRDLF